MNETAANGRVGGKAENGARLVLTRAISTCSA